MTLKKNFKDKRFVIGFIVCNGTPLCPTKMGLDSHKEKKMGSGVLSIRIEFL